ncbi:MAG: L-threonylcarbamoyladenylate synthase [Deltaproteobacteria bacterium]|nr:L-threonylcarbamoyladenylate synthase [Deltaproteobacteria bacterium]
MPRIWIWQEERAEAFFAEARSVLRSRGVLALPTETFYALAVNPFDPAALARLFTLKARPPEKPVLVLIAGPEMLFQVAREVPAAAIPLMTAFWPGPLTLVFPARSDLPPLLTGGTGTIGLRQPRQPVVCRLMAALGLPLTGTSANRSGQEALTTAAAVAREFGDGVDLILEVGPCPGGLPSTIVDVTGVPPRLVRAGAISAARLQEVISNLRS